VSKSAENQGAMHCDKCKYSCCKKCQAKYNPADLAFLDFVKHSFPAQFVAIAVFVAANPDVSALASPREGASANVDAQKLHAEVFDLHKLFMGDDAYRAATAGKMNALARVVTDNEPAAVVANMKAAALVFAQAQTQAAINFAAAQKQDKQRFAATQKEEAARLKAVAKAASETHDLCAKNLKLFATRVEINERKQNPLADASGSGKKKRKAAAIQEEDASIDVEEIEAEEPMAAIVLGAQKKSKKQKKLE
jgi:hypothetical protein